MWNVWHKAFIGAIVMILTRSPALAVAICSLWVVMELKSGDFIKNQVQALTRVPGVTISHNNMLDIMWMVPVNNLLERIPFLKKIKTSPQELREKLGFFAENHVLGFILGVVLGVASGYNAKQTLTLAIQAAASLTLFPMVAQLFMQALAPISEAAGAFMKKRFPGRQFYIGLDWPILGGQPTLWTACILDIPIILLCAVFIPGNITLPFGSILMLSFAMAATVLTQGDLVRTWILMAIATPFAFLSSNWFAPMITQMALQTGAVTLPKGSTQITWLAHNAQFTRVAIFKAAEVFGGKMWPGIAVIPIFAGLYWYYVREMKRREAKAIETIEKGE